MGLVGGQATANGLLRRCWSPDQQQQLGMHLSYKQEVYLLSLFFYFLVQ
jgi:hypothetical protein